MRIRGRQALAICPQVESVDLCPARRHATGKTKAFELFGEFKPTFVIEVPNVRNDAARPHWRAEHARLVAARAR
jgi:benzoyl-CoA reductase/2-hydroxyglutaryl-CoA dehydratase subunit BcrC/BadD/HgdB